MPTKPKIANFKGTRESIATMFNAIRNNATANYRNYVPEADNHLENLPELGSIIMDMPALRNEFLSALMNRIALVLVTSKSYQNPLAVLKKGKIDLGETVEEVFVNIAKPFQYDPAVAENKIFARENPDVRAAFHILNYKKFYKVTIQDNELELAFLSWEGIRDLITKIVETLYTSANYDEYVVMKYMLAKSIVNGRLNPVQIPTVSPTNMRGIAASMKALSNGYEFMKTKYNVAGVANYSTKDRQYLISTADFDASMDVEVLASAFNMSKAEFLGHRILIDSFTDFDNERLVELFGNNNPDYVPFTQDELTALEAVPAVLVDRDWFMIFDKLFKFTENYNGEGLYWNYWYHTWKIFSISPFANASVFVSGAPSVTSITVSPETATIYKGQDILLSATVVTENFASKEVKWTVEGVDGVTIDIYGNLYVPADAESGTVTVTATSVFDPSVSATATVTIS